MTWNMPTMNDTHAPPGHHRSSPLAAGREPNSFRRGHPARGRDSDRRQARAACPAPAGDQAPGEHPGEKGAGGARPFDRAETGARRHVLAHGLRAVRASSGGPQPTERHRTGPSDGRREPLTHPADRRCRSRPSRERRAGALRGDPGHPTDRVSHRARPHVDRGQRRTGHTRRIQTDRCRHRAAGGCTRSELLPTSHASRDGHCAVRRARPLRGSRRPSALAERARRDLSGLQGATDWRGGAIAITAPTGTSAVSRPTTTWRISAVGIIP